MKLSIITPTFNRADTIGKTIESIIRHKKIDCEHIIVDDCSTDNTAEVVKQYKKGDKRIKYIPLKKNIGFMNARNLGIEKASGDWISFMDSDDEYLPDGLAIIYKYLKKFDIDYGCVQFPIISRDIEGNDERIGYKPNEEWKTYKASYEDIVLKRDIKVDMHRCVKTVLAQKNPYWEHNPGLELMFYARIAKLGNRFIFVNKPAVLVHQDPTTQHSANRFQRWPLQFANAYIKYCQEHYEVLENSDKLFDYYTLITKCFWWGGKYYKSLYWLGKTVVINPKQVMKILRNRLAS